MEILLHYNTAVEGIRIPAAICRNDTFTGLSLLLKSTAHARKISEVTKTPRILRSSHFADVDPTTVLAKYKDRSRPATLDDLAERSSQDGGKDARAEVTGDVTWTELLKDGCLAEYTVGFKNIGTSASCSKDLDRKRAASTRDCKVSRTRELLDADPIQAVTFTPDEFGTRYGPELAIKTHPHFSSDDSPAEY